MMDPFDNKLMKGATLDQKLEISIRALGQAAKVFTLAADHLSQVADRLDEGVKRLNEKAWEKAINERLEERRKDGTSAR